MEFDVGVRGEQSGNLESRGGRIWRLQRGVDAPVFGVGLISDELRFILPDICD